MLTLSQPLKGVVQKKVPIYFVLLAALIPTLLYLYKWTPYNKDKAGAVAAASTTDSFSNFSGNNGQDMYRLKNYELTKPLLFTELRDEDQSMSSLKQNLNGLFEGIKSRGEAKDISIFVRKLNTGGWIALNSNEKYAPGSMFKVAILMTYLKMLENDPGLFEKELILRPDMVPNKTQYVDESHISPGSYKIRFLIDRMIKQSDNYATMLLNTNINDDMFTRLFLDAGLPPLDIHASVYNMTVKEYSRIMLMLYNSTYLSHKNSEFALSLLTQSQFRNGIIAGINNEQIKVAHKFGESGDGRLFELHETGIVYYENNPYLLVIMSRGQDITKLPVVLKDATSMVQQYMAAH